MISAQIKKIFGSRNDRLIRQYSQTVRAINALEPAISALSDAELRAKTDEFRQRLANGEELDALLPEAFAVVREAGKRVHGMRLIMPNWKRKKAPAKALGAITQKEFDQRGQ